MALKSRMRISLALAAVLLASTTIAGAQTLPSDLESRVRTIEVYGTEDVGTYEGVAYNRTYGTLSGIVDAREDVAGLGDLPKNDRGLYEYTTQFEVIAPAPGQRRNEVIFIDAENRGNAVMLNLVNEAGIAGPPSRPRFGEGVGNGFFQRHATSYARVQWQTKIAKDVPEAAQGVGLVIMRDFARMLAGYTANASKSGYSPGSYTKLVLGGKSQSSWMVNDFFAEGFNVEPISGKAIFQGAISVDGLGHWMALNKLAAEHNLPQSPYIGPNEKPLQKAELLSRPDTDPVFVDVAAYTDFYRLRASLSDFATTTPKYRRYDIPGPHGSERPPVEKESFGKCNNGEAVPLNPISMSPYIRANIIGIEKAIGVRAAQSGPSLPPSVVFKLGPAPKSTANFNPLPGSDIRVPLVDANAMPVGGVRFPDADHPMGKPVPASIAPVITTSINDTCGNRGGFQPFTTAELNKRYGSKEKYLELYGQAVEKLVSQGFLLAEDEQAMLGYAEYLWDHAESYIDDGKQAAAQ
jgi:hypothetical protein